MDEEDFRRALRCHDELGEELLASEIARRSIRLLLPEARQDGIRQQRTRRRPMAIERFVAGFEHDEEIELDAGHVHRTREPERTRAPRGGSRRGFRECRPELVRESLGWAFDIA
jgi:hypothetical protein